MTNICMLGVSILFLSTIFRLDFGTVQTLWYFFYNSTNNVVFFFITVQTMWYFFL
jgi:hypothetical protein